MLKQKTYLVTGGAGFIGSHICETLLQKGNKVICFDNLSSGKMENIEPLKKNSDFAFIQGDANNAKDLEPIFKNNNLDGVFHYAALVGVKRTLENPLAVLKDIDGIKYITELALAYGRPKIVFASSSEVYGEPKELPEREDGTLDAKMPYAAVKLIGEKFFESYWQQHGLKTASLRFFNVYGPKQESSDYGFVVGIFIKQVLAAQSPTVFGDGKGTRDFVFIADNVGAAIKAMESDTTNGQVINIGRGKPITILELANMVILHSGNEGKLEPVFMENKRIDIMHRAPDITKMRELLGASAQVSLEEGLKKTIEYYKNLK